MPAPFLTDSATSAPFADVAPRTPGLWTRVARTFVAPTRLFADFDDRAPWLGVLVISTVVAIVAAVSLPPEFYLSQMEDPANRLGRPVEVTSGAEEIVRYGRYLQAFSALAAHPIVTVALAALLTFLFTTIGRGSVSFRTYIAVAAHALLIPALGVVVALGLQTLTGNPEASPTLARLLSLVGVDPATLPFLDSLNLFSIWMLAVLGVAVAVLDRRPSWLRPAAVLLGLYLLVGAVSVLLPA